MTDDPLRDLTHLAGGEAIGTRLVCADCGADDDYMAVDPGDLRHAPCWKANVNGGRMVREHEPKGDPVPGRVGLVDPIAFADADVARRPRVRRSGREVGVALASDRAHSRRVGDRGGLVRLNLGCGGQIVEGWVNVDKGCGPGIYCLNITGEDEWPWPVQSADVIVMHHVVDLLTVAQTRRVLERCFDTLTLGGVLRVSSADHERACRAAIDGDTEWFPEPIHYGAAIGKPTSTIDFGATVGYFITQGGARKQLLTVEGLAEMCKVAGFPHFYTCPAGATMGPAWAAHLDSRARESWFAEAIR